MLKLQVLGFVFCIISHQVHAVSDEQFEQKGLTHMSKVCFESPLCKLLVESLHQVQRREANNQIIEDDSNNPNFEELQEEEKPSHRVARQAKPLIIIPITSAPIKIVTKKEESAKIKIEGMQPNFNFQITTAKPVVAATAAAGGIGGNPPIVIKLGGNQPPPTQPPVAIVTAAPVTTAKPAPVVVAPVAPVVTVPAKIVTLAAVNIVTTPQPLITGACLVTPYEEPEGVTVNVDQMIRDANDELSRDQVMLPIEKINEVFFAGFALGYDPGSATMLTMALSNGQEYEAMYDDMASFGGGDEGDDAYL